MEISFLFRSYCKYINDFIKILPKFGFNKVFGLSLVSVPYDSSSSYKVLGFVFKNISD